jgi:serine/threonine protein phosphatase PrpC
VPLTLSVRHAALSDIGLQRTTNEDAFIDRAPLFAVADGMGGAQAGEVASALAMETLAAVGDEPLAAAAGRANARIFALAQADEEHAGMGTTLTAFRLRGAQAEFAHIGDSRAYLLRGGRLEQLTEDHSLVGQWVREGAITPEEAAVNRYRSVLSRALGTEAEAEVDHFVQDLAPGDVVLLCSDGLSGSVPNERIAEVLGEHDPDEAAHLLVREAKNRGGHDNITVVVVQVLAGDGAEEDTIVGGVAEAAAADEPASAAEEQTSAAAGPAGGEQTVDAGMQPAPPSGTPASAPAARRRSRRLVVLAVIVAILVTLLVAATVTTTHVYYVGVDDGNVAVFRGLPWGVGPLKLSRVYLRTMLPAASLSPADQQRVGAHHISGKGAATSRVSQLGGLP